MTESIVRGSLRPWVDVDLDALVRNARRWQSAAGLPLLPMLKADGYGLGAVPVARALEAVDPWGYGVAHVEEAAELRGAGVRRPILVFMPLDPAVIGAYGPVDARPCIGDVTALEAWLAAGEAPFHLEIDTGMRRAGIPYDDLPAVSRAADLVREAAGWEGVFTHFHSADTDPDSVRTQWERFTAVLTVLGRRPPLVHAASSAAAESAPGSVANLARPGIFLYGGRAGALEAEAVARFQARVVAVRAIGPGATVSYGATWSASRATTIATVGAGYADGIHRSLSRGGGIEVAGRVCPIAGRVTMDLTMVDVGDVPVAVGDAATIFGGAVSLDQQAAAAGTISYELLTALGPRVERRYTGGGTG